MPGLTYTIADLIRQQGQTQANALREQANLRARQQVAAGQGWGQAIADIGHTIATIPAQRQQAQRQAALAELDTLKAQELRGEMADKASARQRAEAFQAVLAKHDNIDDAVNDPGLMRADPERYSELMQKHVLPARKAAEDERTRKNTFIAQQLGSAEDQGTWTKARYTVGQVYPDAVKDMPEDFEQAKPIIRSTLFAALPPEKQIEERLKQQPKPEADFTLGPGQTRFGPTGQPIANVPATAGASAGFTLSPGQTRYDAEGKPIAASAPRPTAGEKPEKKRGVTSGDADRLADISNGLKDLKTLKDEIGTTGASSKLGAMAPNFITEYTGFGESAKQRQAVIDRVKQVIGKSLEGGVLRKEDEYKYVKILPTIGDPPPVAATKLAGLEAALKRKHESLLESLEDAGYDTSRFRARAESAPAPTTTTKKNPFRK